MNGMGNREAGGDITGRASTYSYEQARGSRRRTAPTELHDLGMNLGRTVCNRFQNTGGAGKHTRQTPSSSVHLCVDDDEESM